MRINYRRILQNHIFTNTERKYVMLLPFERRMFALVEEWKTNLMSLAILFHFLYAQHVSDINTSIFRSLRLCCWITTSVVLFCKDVWFSVSVNLRCMVACVWCDVFCRFVVVGRCILIDIDRYLLKYTYQLQQSDKTHHTKHTPPYTVNLH